jgi:DNA-binding transcriptional LysR family regulator
VLPRSVARLHPGLVLVRDLPEIPRREVWLAMHRSVRRADQMRAITDLVYDTLATSFHD